MSVPAYGTPAGSPPAAPSGRRTYSYQYVPVRNSRNVWTGSGAQTAHREVINDYARRGFRYAGYVPTKINSEGQIVEMDLIFES